ncbi:hypothetical protein FB645_004886 [Coemansia sp. IMI 203386]|nr:hypothetical protein FB645_004886 [Coemansia sp. IMI 203386]
MRDALYIPAKRRLSMADPFFDIGNAETAISYYTQQQSASFRCTDSNSAIPEGSDPTPCIFLESVSASSAAAIVCEQPPCIGSVLCPNLLAYERHYDQMHRNVCLSCYAILPSAHWLDLHIDECHDAFFAVRAQRNDSVFRCFLPFCSETFVLADDRKKHMVATHGFASSFNWNLVNAGMLRQETQNEETELDECSDGILLSSCSSSMEVDKVASEFKKSLRVSAPDAITFGQPQ